MYGNGTDWESETHWQCGRRRHYDGGIYCRIRRDKYDQSADYTRGLIILQKEVTGRLKCLCSINWLPPVLVFITHWLSDFFPSLYTAMPIAGPFRCRLSTKQSLSIFSFYLFIRNVDFKISYLDLALVNHVEIVTFVTCLSITNNAQLTEKKRPRKT